MRITLRSPIESDAAPVAPWLPEAVAAVQGRGTAAQPALALDALLAQWDAAYPTGKTLIGALPDGGSVGLVRVRDTEPERLVIDALTVRADARNLGHGQEIVFALEEERLAGQMAAAGVPRTNGLAVYFWLRVGYHPLYPRDGGRLADLDPVRLWMVRELGSGGGLRAFVRA